MTSLNYKELDLHNHVLLRPDTYVGSIRKESKTDYIYRHERFELAEFTHIPAISRIFVEALSNAIDNKWRSDEMEIPFKGIRVELDKETGKTSVWNDGYAIPVKKNDRGIWIPEMLFGRLLTSSNYDDSEERFTSGKNGLGITLCNIFSSSFSIKIVDPVNGMMYSQKWSDNMKTKKDPVIEHTNETHGYVKVSWIPDFKYFGIKGYSDDTLSYLSRYVYDAAVITGVPVYLNQKKIVIKSLREYAPLYFSEENNKKELVYVKYGRSEIVLTPSNGEFENISFVNGIRTTSGGTHVDSWVETIFRPLSEKLNKKYKNIKLNVKDLKKYFRLFVNATVPNPEFASQTKERLTAPKVPSYIDNKNINSIIKWEWIEEIEDLVKARELLTLKKSERKTGYTKIEGFDPANNAGGKESYKCTLIVCEGLSAKTFAVTGLKTGIDYGEGVLKGRAWNGILPLRGKILNVRNANVQAISKNKEVSNIIKALGVQYGVDYTIDENFKKLRYGRVMSLCDSDCDGLHIQGLLMNMFDVLFPSLLQRKGFFIAMQTPVMKIQKKGKTVRFYDTRSAQKYLDEHRNETMTVKYYKGLGTSSDKDVVETFSKRIITYSLDEDARANLNKVFHKDFTDVRKEWLQSYDPNHDEYYVSTRHKNISDLSVSHFMNTEMVKFSIDDCKRSIPHVMDGFKESHRKVLYATFLKNIPASKTIKVAQLAGYVAEKTNYHHGESNLYDTITKMAQNFVGSNNVPLLYPDGQHGSRIAMGQDAANARYIFTRLQNYTKQIFDSRDFPVLSYIEEEGEKIEPEFYVPILPTVLINGVVAGIGTGWSSSVPCYNPDDLRKWILCYLKNSATPELIPWYNGFKGRIYKLDDKKFITEGIVEKQGNKMKITEIPVGMSFDKMKESLEDLVENKKIKNLKNFSSKDQPHFEFTVIRLKEKDLPMTSSLPITNLVLFDSENRIRKYRTVDDILKEFCEVRLRYYGLRKSFLLSKWNKEKSFLSNKHRFIEKIIKEKLVVFKRPEEDIIRDLEKMKFDRVDGKFDYLLNIKVRSFTESKVNELKQEIENISKNIDVLNSKNEKDLWKEDLKSLKLKL